MTDAFRIGLYTGHAKTLETVRLGSYGWRRITWRGTIKWPALVQESLYRDRDRDRNSPATRSGGGCQHPLPATPSPEIPLAPRWLPLPIRPGLPASPSPGNREPLAPFSLPTTLHASPPKPPPPRSRAWWRLPPLFVCPSPHHASSILAR